MIQFFAPHSLMDARDFKAEVRREVRTGSYVDPNKSKERFGEFAAKWLQTKVDKKAKTYASYESSLCVHVSLTSARCR
jgi:hypothetical protein